MLVQNKEGQEALSDAVQVLKIDRQMGLVTYNGQTARLQHRQMDFFMFLYEHRSKNVGRDALMYNLYQFHTEDPNEKILDVLVCHLRKRLQPLGLMIETIWGFGYRLNLSKSVVADIVDRVTLADME